MKFTKIKENLYKGDNEELYQLHKVSNTKGVMKKVAEDEGDEGGMVTHQKVMVTYKVDKRLIKQFGEKGVQLLMQDILDRYFDASYFDPDFVEELTTMIPSPDDDSE